ncbi:peptidase A4 family protein [Colletotrichum graminicola]|uniref:Peptidase A4 family protein n=1 Tax=Colletotrichum graminicola (strain M1.001 / M2 / FGSC 10212) TaxID=645133 RepID=E3Q8P2_COLGM|nr:peptidase A4 family protein [Colletotrichum graminicola M1.001]EFQ27406.1 peptidase A4 family protein [Colletotrichum graminicola M1.001]WDK13204.1 peptidase A4 family protein [Colletotrichum graminicola]
MKFSAFALAAAGIVAAAPGTKLVQRDYSPLVPRSARARHSSAPNRRLSAESVESLTLNSTGVKNAHYSSNWSGAVQIGNGYNHVTGTITVPEVSGNSGDAASAWVGIDGDTCETAILQTGISLYADGTFDAWYEWIPDNAYSFDNFDVSVGDQIQMTVDASSTKKGVATLHNLTTGKKVTHTFTSTPSTLCETNAEWIVEAFQEGGKQVTLADFGTIEFTGATASGSGGSITPSGAEIFDISPNGGKTYLTQASSSGSTVTVSYIG